MHHGIHIVVGSIQQLQLSAIFDDDDTINAQFALRARGFDSLSDFRQKRLDVFFALANYILLVSAREDCLPEEGRFRACFEEISGCLHLILSHRTHYSLISISFSLWSCRIGRCFTRLPAEARGRRDRFCQCARHLAPDCSTMKRVRFLGRLPGTSDAD
jgi:hypothetical protein